MGIMYVDETLRHGCLHETAPGSSYGATQHTSAQEREDTQLKYNQLLFFL